MAAALVRPSSASRRLVTILQQQIQLHPGSFQQNARLLHTNDPSSTAKAASSAQEAPAIKSYDELPGPRPLPIIGNMWRFLPYIGEYHGMQLKELQIFLYKKYGDIFRLGGIMGREDLLFVYRPEEMEITFRNEGIWPIRTESQSMQYYRDVLRKDFYKNGGGVLTDNGKRWFEARSKANQPMMQPKISKRYVDPIGGVADEFVEIMRKSRDDKDELPADFLNELFKWSLESIAYVALDTRLGCLEPNLPPDSDPQRMIKAVDVVFECLFPLEIGPPVWKIFPTPTWNKYVKALDTFLEISVKYVDEAVQRSNKRKAEGIEDSDPSVLERLLASGDRTSATIMAQDMLFAGVDTTSVSIALAIYLISKNPDKQDMLFKELKRILPTKNDAITEEKLESMKYLKACLKESARILPIIPGNTRTTVKEIILKNYRIPKGVRVVMPTVISCASDEYFPLSQKYIPERWLKNRPTEETTGCTKDFDTTTQGKKQPFASLPFGFGPRSCIGKRFAELEMEILLAKLIRKFHIEYNYKDMTFFSGILYTPKDPLRFKLTERKE